MGLTIEMHDPQDVFFEEITDRAVTQDSVAITYAFMIAQLGDAADWPRINTAIRERWKGKTALVRVKEAAWKHVEYWKERGRQERAEAVRP